MGEFRPSKPGERRGGRPKGGLNKATADLKGMILGALAGAGGEAYLQRQAETNPAAFLTLIGKVLPTTLVGAGGGALRIEVVTGVPRDDGPPLLEAEEIEEFGVYQIETNASADQQD